MDEYRTLLKTHFGIDLGAQLETLWNSTARVGAYSSSGTPSMHPGYGCCR